MKKYQILVASLVLVVGSGFATVSCSDDDDYNQVIEFAPGSGDFVVGKSTILLAGTQETSFAVKSPVRPTVSSSADWLRVGAPDLKSNNIYTVSVQADANLAYDPRTATITVSAGSQNSTITVTQVGAETVQLLSEASVELDPNGGVLEVRYAATSAVDIKAPSWLTLQTGRGLVEDVARFAYQPNLGEEARGGDIVISLSTDPTIQQVVAVSQGKTNPADMNKTAVQIASDIRAGINIGNTMEPPSGEGTWGTGLVTLDYVKGLKQLGFNAVRIPCAWDSHATDGVIDAAWLDRVDEVVGYVVGEGMYAIVNIHWDGGWLEEHVTTVYDPAVDKKQHDYWTQIASKLGHYDYHLLFAGMNEPGQQDMGGVNAAAIDNIMKYQQTFVDAVRATGGNNAQRVLIHQTPYTNIDQGTAGRYKLPNDAVADRMMVEVHFYDPSDYTIMGKDGEWGTGSTVKLYWGKENLVDGSKRNCTWGDAAYIDGQFKKIQDMYVSKGVPGIVGEYSSAIRSTTDFPEMDTEKWKAGRAAWNECVTMSAKNHGLVPFYWETGGDINRNNGSAKNAYAIDALIKGADAAKYPF